jgi:hypothetical protein
MNARDQLPHDPYIAAVIAALTTAGLEPDDAWTSDAETDPYGDGTEMMLSAVLRWNGDHTAIADAALPDGMLLLWEHSAEQWQWAEVRPDGSNELPDWLPHLPIWSDPAAVVTTLQALLAGLPAPETDAVEWPRADESRAAVAAWAADGGDA